MDNIKKAVVYIDIESLMDLRMGYMATNGLNFQDIKDRISSIEYDMRLTDNVEGLEDRGYEKAVAEGKKDLLVNSMITYITTHLQVQLSSITTSSTREGLGKTPEIWLNVYPFVLTEQEKEAITEAVFLHSGRSSFVEIISKPLSAITLPMLLANKVECVYIYDFVSWLDYNDDYFSERINGISFFFPPLAKVKLTPEEEKEFKSDFEEIDFFTSIKTSLGTLINLDFLPLGLYNSAIIAQEKFAKIAAVNTENFKKEREKKEKEGEDNGFSCQRL